MHDTHTSGPTGRPDARQPARGLPAHWLRFLYRVMGLRRGCVYTIAIIVPERASEEPHWAILAAAQLENR